MVFCIVLLLMVHVVSSPRLPTDLRKTIRRCLAVPNCLSSLSDSIHLRSRHLLNGTQSLSPPSTTELRCFCRPAAWQRACDLPQVESQCVAAALPISLERAPEEWLGQIGQPVALRTLCSS